MPNRLAAMCTMLVALGCPGATSRYIDRGTTGQGVHWLSVQDEKAEHIERMIELTRHAFIQSTGVYIPRWSARGVTVEFRQGRVPCDSTDCHGVLMSDGRYILLKSEPCIPYTSLAHELVHYYAWIAFGEPDKEHRDRRLFRDADSATWRATAAGIHEGMCDG